VKTGEEKEEKEEEKGTQLNLLTREVLVYKVKENRVRSCSTTARNMKKKQKWKILCKKQDLTPFSFFDPFFFFHQGYRALSRDLPRTAD
jgi:hypothetical protein